MSEDLETAFRKGFYAGIKDALKALSEGVSIEQMTEYLKTTLYEWRFHTGLNRYIPIPPFPKPRATHGI